MHIYCDYNITQTVTYVTLRAPTCFNPKGSSSGSQILITINVHLLVKANRYMKMHGETIKTLSECLKAIIASPKRLKRRISAVCDTASVGSEPRQPTNQNLSPHT